jgi:divalent metal cation (Fe/Co/Zn/Cd) transporter
VSVTKIIGIVLLIVGVVILVLGAYNLISYNNSTGGKIANKAAGFWGTQTETVKNSWIQIGVGAVCAVVGFVLYRKR